MTTDICRWAICSLGELPEAARSYRPTHLVSIMGDCDEFIRPLPVAGDHHFVARFDDIAIKLNASDTVPTRRHIEEILEFTAPVGVADRLLIHCVAGISRSPAVAIGVAVQKIGTSRLEEAVGCIFRLRPSASPNRLILKHLDDIFGTCPEIEHLVCKVLKRYNAAKILTSCKPD